MCLPFCHRCRLDGTKQGDIPLFPGYIFCKFDAKDRLRLFMIPGVTAVMSFGEKPLAMPENEICALQNIIDSGLHYEPSLFLNFIVPISLLRRSVAVEIEKESVRASGEERKTWK